MGLPGRESYLSYTARLFTPPYTGLHLPEEFSLALSSRRRKFARACPNDGIMLNISQNGQFNIRVTNQLRDKTMPLSTSVVCVLPILSCKVLNTTKALAWHPTK